MWVNGRLAVEHEGGYLPFEAEIGALVRPGRNEVAVAVTAPTDDRELYPDFPVGEVPFGKQSWYGPLGGIWQSVHLERRAADHVRAVRLTPCLRTGRVDVALELSHRLMRACELELEITDPDGAVVASPRSSRPRAMTAPPPLLFVLGPLPWSPETPRLYRVTATLRRAGELLDALSETFGFRTVEARDGRIYLNGEPVYLRGALDQDYYPDGICTPPSERLPRGPVPQGQGARAQLRALPHQGAGPALPTRSPTGWASWSGPSCPTGGRLTEQAAERLRATMAGHPRARRQPPHHRRLDDHQRELGHGPGPRRASTAPGSSGPTAGSRRSTRPGWSSTTRPAAPNFHVETDLDDFHFYAALPDHRPAWDGFATSFADRARAPSARTATRSAPAASRSSAPSSATGACPTRRR